MVCARSTGKLGKALPIKVTELLTEGGVPAAKARKCGESADKSLAPFAETVLCNRLVDIPTLKVGQYMQPLDENFPAIDAFCVSAGVPWEPDAGREPVLLLLKMTVHAQASSRGADDQGRHRSRTQPEFLRSRTARLVFVTDQLLETRAEPYLTIGSYGRKKLIR